MSVPNANASSRDRMSRRGGDRLQRGLFGDNRAHGFLPPLRWISRRQLRQLGYQLLKFGLRPNAGSAGPHAPLRAERECEFRRVVAVRSIDDDQEIALAGREVDLLDLNSHFLGQVLSGFGALGSILDRADSLVGPVQQTHKRRHGILRVITPQRLPTAAEAAVDLWGVKRDGDAKKSGVLPRDRARRRHYRCALTRTEFRHVPLQKGSSSKRYTARPADGRQEKEETLAREFDGLIPARCEVLDHRLAVFR